MNACYLSLFTPGAIEAQFEQKLKFDSEAQIISLNMEMNVKIRNNLFGKQLTLPTGQIASVVHNTLCLIYSLTCFLGIILLYNQKQQTWQRTV